MAWAPLNQQVSGERMGQGRDWGMTPNINMVKQWGRGQAAGSDGLPELKCPKQDEGYQACFVLLAAPELSLWAASTQMPLLPTSTHLAWLRLPTSTCPFVPTICQCPTAHWHPPAPPPSCAHCHIRSTVL